ncbi:MAG: hypothetical protein HQM11_17740 [SAR324 cluster bacterium]|nr:hypothetical protein [SAR324 cluster bacterium]
MNTYFVRVCISLFLVVGIAPNVNAGQMVLRHVLGIYDSGEDKTRTILKAPDGTRQDVFREPNPVQTFWALILNHYGFVLTQLDIQQDPLPDQKSMAGYALIISWFRDFDEMPDPEAYVNWMEAQVEAGKKILLIGRAGFRHEQDDPVKQQKLLALKKRLYALVDLDYRDVYFPAGGRVKILEADPQMLNFERKLVPPYPDYEQLIPFNDQVRTYLKLGYLLDNSSESSAVSIAPKGGYVATGFAVYSEVDPPFRKQWLINPFLFIKTLMKPAYPVPDVTTSAGKRVAFFHIDGDGFRNISEVDSNKYSVEVLIEKILKPYDKIPLGFSLIVGDLHPDWWGTPKLQELARTIYNMPHVEAATHLLTHPFNWKGSLRTSAYSPEGTWRLERELDDGVEWMNEHLMPPGKKVKMVYWSGNTTPPEEAFARAERLGLDNINGGDTKKDYQFPSYTSVSALMRNMGHYWQIFTGSSNENLYTKNWTDNFFGFRAVIQTFENTEKPLRVKPVNVYYHLYIADKVSSLGSLQAVYDWTQQQSLSYLFPSEYAQTVRGFISTRIELSKPGVFSIHERGTLNNFRLDSGSVDLSGSIGVRTVNRVNDSWYVDLDPHVTVPQIAIKQDKDL